MPISYEYKKESNLIETQISGVLSSEEIAEYFGKLRNEITLKPGFIEIVDFNQAEDLILKYSDLNRLSELFKALTEKGHQITLFCAYSNHAQDLLNMMMPLFHTMKINLYVCKNKGDLELHRSVFENKTGQ